jgi:hypothetical protein
VIWFVAFAWRGGIAWHFFVQGQQVLTDPDTSLPGGLHLYAHLPQLQIGPVTLLTAWLFSPFGPRVSLLVAQLFGAGVGLVILALVQGMAAETRPDLSRSEVAWRTRLAAIFFIPVWLYLAVGSTHLDDVLALLFGMLATYAALHQRAALAGLLIGLSVDSKPWALPFAATLLILTTGRARVIGVAVLTATVAVCWAPFLLADPHTLNAVRFTIPNTSHTALRVLGITDPRTPPWDRPAQSVLGLLLAGTAVRRGRWAAVILVVVATRLVLDPGTNMYYPGGLVAGALLWDIVGSARTVPRWTAAAASALFVARYAPLPPSVNGWLTLAFFLACVGFVVVPGAD